MINISKKDNIFVFTTYDIENKEKNVFQNAISLYENIEGVWVIILLLLDVVFRLV